MTLTIEIPPSLEAVLKARVSARGISATAYVLHLLERDLASAIPAQPALENAPAAHAEEINTNRVDMFPHFDENEGEDF